MVPKSSGQACTGVQGTLLKRLAVTKRMKGGEFHSPSSTLPCSTKNKLRGRVERGEERWETASGGCWASVHASEGGGDRTRAVEA